MTLSTSERTLNEALPLVTIGITAFNAVHTIERALQSAVSQTWSRREIVIVDDCSTDGTAQVLEKLVADIPHARLIQNRVNRGAAAARNSLMNAAKGEFLAFFDDDDESLPARVERQVSRLVDHAAAHPGAMAACFASGVKIYPNGYRQPAEAIGSRPRAPMGSEVVDYLLFNERRAGVFYGAGTPTCSLMIRTGDLVAIGGFDESLRRVEDVDLAIRLALSGAHFIGCAEQLYLQHATFSDDKGPTRNLVAELALLEKHREYLHAVRRYEYARRWFMLREAGFKGDYITALWRLMRVLATDPLRASRHFLRSAPRRLRHQYRMAERQR